MTKRFEIRAVFCPGGLETQPRRLEYEEQVVSGGNEIRKLERHFLLGLVTTIHNSQKVQRKRVATSEGRVNL